MDEFSPIFQKLETIQRFRDVFIDRRVDVLEITDHDRTLSLFMVKDKALLAQALALPVTNIREKHTKVVKIESSSFTIGRSSQSPSPLPSTATTTGSTTTDLSFKPSSDSSTYDSKWEEEYMDSTLSSCGHAVDLTIQKGDGETHGNGSDTDIEMTESVSTAPIVPNKTLKVQPQRRVTKKQEEVKSGQNDQDWIWLNQKLPSANYEIKDRMWPIAKTMINTRDDLNLQTFKEPLEAHARLQDQREPENDPGRFDVKAAFVRCWRVTSRLCDEGFFNDVRYRVAVADLHVKLVEASKKIGLREGLGPKSAISCVRRRYFETTHEYGLSLKTDPGTDYRPVVRSVWSRFINQLTRSKRWDRIREGLGHGVLALMPVECHFIIHQKLKKDDVPIFIDLVERVNPGAIALGIEEELKQGLADLRI
ncbi:hypothetical protein BDV97DRAFT_345996 [Delphinella strobiligena]|nr:hypothetical protein BDV97DRAFT_345996 [Delphinella strobiligena]